MAAAMMENIGDLESYGAALNAAEAQQKAAFESIATSAQSLANTLGWTEDEIDSSSSIANGGLAEKLYNEALADMEGVDLKHINDRTDV